MSKANFDEECKICAKPFTVFCWTPGKRERRKKTEICQICAKLKNLCQSCILDLQYKAPFEIRDALIEGWNYTTNKKQQTEVHREYFALQAAKKVEQNDIPDYSSLPKVQTSNIIFPNVHPYKKNDHQTENNDNNNNNEIPQNTDQNYYNYNYYNYNNYQQPYYHPNQPVNVPTLQFPTISEEISSQNPYALDPNNKTVFIGGINDTITEEDLR
eukprot:TRINITY_DN7460_c0_g1_i4.p1 TRINITY_DN7460_c0_g1~~TRINITY_DN7460_c0_g1_i4.p1  ORF type:complete len:243 (-),score=57.60 TRINITY_DN7460_c0_g1_i4:33-674(-)